MPADNAFMEVKTKEAQDPETESESETESEKQSETEAKEEHFLEKADGVDSLDASQFSSQRLVVLASDSDTVIDPEHMIGQYDNIYLLQYTSVEQTMNAYVYYLSKAEAVEPDTAIVAASDETDAETESGTVSETESQPEIETSVPEETEPQEIPSDVTADAIDNPISTLAGEQDSAVVQAESKVIALLDTGAEGSNVIDQVSMIDGGLVGSSTHAGNMVAAITEQNPDAKILSVRVLGDDNLGTISSIVAGMEYAIAQDVDFINLSLYARKSLSNSVLASEIQKAKDAGIEVVGAAGNDGADVINYMPGSVESAWIIGACDEYGVRLDSSNYGTTVDYNVVGTSTSVSTARFTGYISANGTENISSGFIFTSDGTSTDREEVSDKDEDFEAAAALSGTKTWGSDAVDFVYGSGFIGHCAWKYATFHGFGAQKKSTRKDNGTKGTLYRVCTRTGSFSSSVYIEIPNIGGYFDGNTYQRVDGRVYCYGNNSQGFIAAAAGKNNKFMFMNIAKCTSLNPIDTDIYLRYRFYKHGTNTEVSMKGVGAFTDIDGEKSNTSIRLEGYRFDQGLVGLYTSSDTEIVKKTKGTLKNFYVGTVNSTGKNKEKCLMYTFSSTAAKPLEITYHCGGYFGGGMHYGNVTLSYKIEGTIPPGVTAPSSINFAEYTNTSTDYAKLSGYPSAPGYTFSGWHRGSLTGAIYLSLIHI